MSINKLCHPLFLKDPAHKIVMLTAYDHPTARLLDKAGIDVILVGDSVANVVLGLDSTTQVGMDEMLHHTRAVCRGAGRTPVVADMPASAVRVDAVQNARQFIDAGCMAVKIEWFDGCLDVIRSVRQSGIEVIGHVGLTPQTAQEMKVQGRDAASAQVIVDQSLAMEQAGCFALVLECVPEALARQVTESLKIPTIGIGAGKFCDGQVLVLHDMLGLNDRKVPKFVKRYIDASGLMLQAIDAYKKEVSSGEFPSSDQSFH